jgi:hypothetical protein
VLEKTSHMLNPEFGLNTSKFGTVGYQFFVVNDPCSYVGCGLFQVVFNRWEK